MFRKVKHKVFLVVIKIISLNYRAITTIIRQWSPKGKIQVLDLGCGLGNLAPLHKAEGYLGVDLDPESIELAQENYPKYEFVLGSITSFTTPKKFDLVTVIGVFHHINDKEMNQGLDTVKKHLKNHGVAIILEALPPINSWNLIGRVIRYLDQGHYIRPFEDYQKKILNKLRIIHASPRRGGIVDYALFVVGKK